MKLKILQALKTRYANLGFGDKAFDGVADYLSKTVTKDEDVETAITGVESVLKAFQGDVDKVRTELAQKKTELEELKKKNPEPPKSDPPKPDSDEPAWFKSFKEDQAKKLEAIEKENQSFKAEKAKETRSAQVAAKVKELGIPDWRMKGVSVPENLDEAGITTFLTEIKQDIVTAGLSGKPQSGLSATKDEALKQMSTELVDK
ncbi:MAG: hypothetical protein Q8R90_09675, partial [Bacteroidales bacterium]|nr:hypothetical protein [Bacteroidales bacterium]